MTGDIVNATGDGCVTSCPATQGQTMQTGGRCVAAGDADATQCANAGRVRLSGGNCATQCGANTAPTSTTNRQCIAAATACSGTAGYNSGTATCVTSPTSEAQCRAISKVRLSGGNCAAMCGSNNAPTNIGTNNQCVAATTACTGTAGYNSGTATCVANPTNEAQCRALSKVRLMAGNSCATMCGANNAPTNIGTNNQCATASSVCAATDGYNSGTRTCVTSGHTASTCQAFPGTMRVLEGSTCAAMCNANRAPNSTGTCAAASTVCTTAQGYNSGTRVCVSSPNAAQCQALSRVRLMTGGTCAAMCAANNAPTSSSNRQCVAATTACMTGAQGYDSSSRTCIAAGSVNAAADCAVFTGATGKNLFQSGTGCVTASACRTGNRAVSGMTCIAGTAAACLADGGRGFTLNTGCVTPTMANCNANNYNFTGGVCVSRITCAAGEGFDSTTNMCVGTEALRLKQECEARSRSQRRTRDGDLNCDSSDNGNCDVEHAHLVHPSCPTLAQCTIANRVRRLDGSCQATCLLSSTSTVFREMFRGWSFGAAKRHDSQQRSRRHGWPMQASD